MKSTAVALLLCVLVVSPASAADGKLSPITRVVELLKGLAEQAEKEGKKEEDLYETYVCWAKTVIDAKTASNSAAESRIQELETYIADLDSGRIELTTERVDLEKEIKSLHQDLESMEAQREKEHEDFLAAEDEMNKAISALEQAVDVLKEATADAHEGTFLQGKARDTEGFQARVAEAQSLSHAVELGEKFLSKGDALFLRRVLTGEVPKADWKKLNRKADFKMSYKARSFEIQDVLAKMLDTFETNLHDATEKENESQTNYEKLKANKDEQLGEAQEALQNQDGENGAKGQSKADSQEEVDALKEQVANDEKYIAQTASDLELKKSEWKDRQTLRRGEIAAINKAISILHSDDARDLFKKSFSSQSFLQITSSSSRKFRAVDVLKSAMHRSGDRRLATLTEPLATGTHFDQVISAIDDMVATLKGEEETDLANKEECESDRAEDTREAIKAARTMDEKTDAITQLKSDIAEIVQTIADNEAEIQKITDELAEATRIRNDEHTAWEASDRDDQMASELVVSAKDVLANFYADNNLMFVQAKMAPVQAGEAPPPPPTTWEAPYGGKTGESTGIVAILEMINEDIIKDRADGEADEQKSLATYNQFKTDSETQIQALDDANTELTGTKGEKEDDVTSNKGERLTQKGLLEAAIAKINDATPGCVYITINYPVRLSNRQIEIDGLIKAKAILEGGEFSEGPDPDREMKPGDAFLQHRK